eukprot:gene18460-24169_t
MALFVIDSSAKIEHNESKVITSVNLVQQTTILPYGRTALDLLTGGRKIVDDSNNNSTNGIDDLADDRIVIPTDVTPENLHKYTYYELLGLSNEIVDTIDINDIRKAYRKAVLVYHPDKTKDLNKDADGVEDNAVFLKLQEGFNVLTNEQKRRTYDSQLPFDDSVPTEPFLDKKIKKDSNKFYSILDPVFKRNARFAVKKPVPSIGDASTPMSEVAKFYDYWINFESWRDFTGKDSEHNPDEASSREEKRWMQKENERIAKKLKKKEMDRIIDLVMLAQKKDPRLIADKESKKQQKEAEKQAREYELNKKAIDEANAKKETERIENEMKEFAQATKADREKLKKKLSGARNILRKLLRHTGVLNLGDGAYGILSEAEMEILCANTDLNDLTSLNEALGGDAATKDTSLFNIKGVDIVKEKFNNIKEQIELNKNVKNNVNISDDTSNNANSKAEREWTRDYLSHLAKAVAKFPAGLGNRWGCVANYMNDAIKPMELFTEDECIKVAFKAAKNLQNVKK